MYLHYFGLRIAPFSIALDPRDLYLGRGQQEALSVLVYGVQNTPGFLLLTGEVGTGKTTLCRRFLRRMPPHYDVAYILNPKVTAIELLASLCDELQISYPAATTSSKVLVDVINRRLLADYARGRKTILMIDEAQNLDAEVLEQLRLLTNLETDEEKLLRIILVGQPELEDVLAQPRLRQLSQRVTARYHLPPLDKQEVAGYVAHSLRRAGRHAPLFSGPALAEVYRQSGGIPRLINAICDRALLGAYAHDRRMVSRGTVRQAAREVLGHTPFWSSKRRIAGVAAAISLALVLPSVVWWYQGTANPLASAADDLNSTPETTVAAPWLAALPASGGQRGAFRALFDHWGLDYQGEGQGSPCEFAENRGLACLSESRGWAGIEDLNRPAVLKLRAPGGGQRYATLVALTPERAVLAHAGATRSVSRDSLTRLWSGDYVVLWRKPPDYPGLVHPGYAGAVVPWLRERLARVDGQDADIERRVYDDPLVQRLSAFQRRAGLAPDGIVGARTLIRLNQATAQQGPTLTEGRR